MSKRALHFLAPTPRGSAKDGPKRTLCGQRDLGDVGLASYDTTAEAVSVTCRVCKRMLARAPERRSEPVDGEAHPGAFAKPQPPISAADHAILQRSLRGEEEVRHPWTALDALLDHVLPVMEDGRPIRSGSDTDRFGVLPQRMARVSSDPANGHDNVISFELALSRVTAAIVEGADRGRLLGGVPWTQSTLATLVLYRTAQKERPTPEALAEIVGRTVRQTQRARALLLGALFFELSRVGLVPRPKSLVEATYGGVRVLEREGRQPMAAPEGFDLEGFKEIAKLIGRSEDAAQRLAVRDSDPLPVEWFGRLAYAKKPDVRAWLAREMARGRVRRAS